MNSLGKRFWSYPWARRCRVFFFILLMTGMSLPALAASPITGVTVTPSTASLNSGQAIFVRATVQGSGDFDHRVTWSLSPLNAGTLSPTGLFISDPAFSGSASVKATSRENPACSGTAAITVAAGNGVVHVDHNNPGPEDGTALHPFQNIQTAIDQAADGYTIKVAQGTYTQNLVLYGEYAVLLLGGFKGGTSADYTEGRGGDFVTRSTDHVTQVSTIQSPTRDTPVVSLGNWAPDKPLVYGVDGFTLTGGSYGIRVDGRGTIDFFISQNLITDNGVLVAGSDPHGGGISVDGVNLVALNNLITKNQSGFGGGFYIVSGDNTFLFQGNLVQDNSCGGDLGGGGCLEGQGLFTWNVIRNNQANLLLSYGYAGGLSVGGGPLELSHNVYANNQSKDYGAGILLYYSAINTILRHELVYGNSNTSDYGGAGIFLQDTASATLDHCTISGNTSPGIEGNGLMVYGAAQVSNSIIWGNSGNQVMNYSNALSMTYSDSQPFPGTGNLSVDPRFADPATGDYHLKSMGGRWNPGTSGWVWDKVHSPCIDAGNPVAAFDQEPFLNRARANMGVYGNTPEASRSKPTLDAMWRMLLLVD
jgi:hypothetical protein